MSEVTININGMSCQHCVMRVKKAIDELNGVNSSEVAVGKAKIDIDETLLSRDDVEKTIKEAGYSIA